jgi:hypothetical protein
MRLSLIGIGVLTFLAAAATPASGLDRFEFAYSFGPVCA